jgi:alkylation response protein AidB-like acyl-CoA dehydrogenase
MMMNAARLRVALQGIGLLAAWRRRMRYSRAAPRCVRGRAKSFTERSDQRTPSHAPHSRYPAWIDAGQVLAYPHSPGTGSGKYHPDAARLGTAQRWFNLVTPLLKATFTQQVVYGSECLQVFGGHGYVRGVGHRKAKRARFTRSP